MHARRRDVPQYVSHGKNGGLALQCFEKKQKFTAGGGLSMPPELPGTRRFHRYLSHGPVIRVRAIRAVPAYPLIWRRDCCCCAACRSAAHIALVGFLRLATIAGENGGGGGCCRCRRDSTRALPACSLTRRYQTQLLQATYHGSLSALASAKISQLQSYRGEVERQCPRQRPRVEIISKSPGRFQVLTYVLCDGSASPATTLGGGGAAAAKAELREPNVAQEAGRDVEATGGGLLSRVVVGGGGGRFWGCVSDKNVDTA